MRGTYRASTLLLLATVALNARLAQAADRFVSLGGTDAANTCSSSASPCGTLAHALTQGASGDVIKVARGTYFENVLIDTSGSFAISGGWSADFSQQDASTSPPG